MGRHLPTRCGYAQGAEGRNSVLDFALLPEILADMLPTAPSLPAKISDLLFFDNLALYYVAQNTPLEVLARILRTADGRLAGSLLGILSIEERKKLHLLMAGLEENPDPKKDKQAIEGIVLVAQDQCKRGLIYKQGLHYFGQQKD